MQYPTVQHHVKEFWIFQDHLCVSVGCPELGYMVAILLGDHLLPRPELHHNAPHFWPALYSSKVFNRLPQSMLSYYFLRYKNTKKSGSWSKIST